MKTSKKDTHSFPFIGKSIFSAYIYWIILQGIQFREGRVCSMSSLNIIVLSYLGLETNLFFNHHFKKTLIIENTRFFPLFLPVFQWHEIRESEFLPWSYHCQGGGWQNLGRLFLMMSSFSSFWLPDTSL